MDFFTNLHFSTFNHTKIKKIPFSDIFSKNCANQTLLRYIGPERATFVKKITFSDIFSENFNSQTLVRYIGPERATKSHFQTFFQKVPPFRHSSVSKEQRGILKNADL
jgi:hypothetical protein